MAIAETSIARVRVIGIRFRRAGRLYYYDPAGSDVSVGNYVIVMTSRGLMAARVVMAATEVDPDDVRGELKPIERAASDTDLTSMTNYLDKETEAEQAFATAITSRGLPMQPVKAEYSFDGAILTLYFSSKEARIDTADLVSELATKSRTRVELRQLGPRERAAMRIGLGRCGREFCCATFLSELDTVSLRMARDQNLPLNPEKISGACGRLLCCLQYEHDGYIEDKLAAEQAVDSDGYATSSKCGTCGVHELKDILGQPVASGHETEHDTSEPEDETNIDPHSQ
jgi:cell fate regulator YaaT (PSP1 superfamily)